MTMPLIEPAPIVRPAAPPWMITFADLLSLLLAFFVMLFATASVDRGDWQRVVAPISSYMTGHTVASPVVMVARPGPPTHDQGYVTALIEARVAGSPALAGAKAARRDRAIVIVLPPEIADGDRQEAAFADLGRMLVGLDNRVEIAVQGVPSDDPALGWQYAADRAARLAGRLSALASNRPIDSVGMLAPTGLAERVELIVVDEHAGV